VDLRLVVLEDLHFELLVEPDFEPVSHYVLADLLLVVVGDRHFEHVSLQLGEQHTHFSPAER
jgi:hypothetical protein